MSKDKNKIIRRRSQSKIIAALLFIFGAIPGLILSLYSAALIIANFVDLNPQVPHPIVSSASVIIGVLMMLAGVGKLNEWRYLYVIFAFAVSFFTYILIEPKLRRGGPETVVYEVLSLFIFSVICSFLTYYRVEAYYRKKEEHQKSSIHS